MPAKVGRRVSPPPWTITEHHEKPVAVSTRVQRHVAGLFADQPARRRFDGRESPRSSRPLSRVNCVNYKQTVPPVSNRRGCCTSYQNSSRPETAKS
jgi:hypothetical protein